MRELRASTGEIKEFLAGNGRIVVTNNSKPVAFMVGVDESTLEETLDDWRKVRGFRILRALQQRAKENGLSDMTLDEINAEIAISRMERREVLDILHQIQMDSIKKGTGTLSMAEIDEEIAAFRLEKK